VIPTPPAEVGRTLTALERPTSTVLVRDGCEVVGLAEALYVRLFVITLAGMLIVCGFAVLAAMVRTQDANMVRTTLLAAGLALPAGLMLRSPRRGYRAMRRWPPLSLTAPVVALAALAADGVNHSPLSFAAAVSIGLPAFVCGRRWALAAATLISVGAVGAATARTGWGAVNSVGQGAIGYFVWALVLAGLAERFLQLTMRMPWSDTPPSEAPGPLRVPNLAGDPPAAPPRASRQPPSDAPVAGPASSARLTARHLEVIALLADGLRAEEIAERLGVATSTVYRHVERAKRRAGVTSRSELVALAIRDGIVPGAAGG
jgi:DNA-binding CsgD family transcriptional regulator